jgi:uncharacterized protein (TIGR02246 family)
MRARATFAFLVLVVCVGGVLFLTRRGPADPPAAAGEPARPAASDAEAIRTAVQGYVAAFNKGDLEGLMAYWSADPEFISDSGETTRGRTALTALFKATFTEQKGATMKITVKSVRFLKPDVALQDGLVTITTADGTPDKGAYTSVWTRTDGKWLLARVQDMPGDSPSAAASSSERLKQLDWMVGDWASEGKNTPVTFTCKWAKNQSFLMVEETIHLKDQEPMTLVQVIGWDPEHSRSARGCSTRAAASGKACGRAPATAGRGSRAASWPTAAGRPRTTPGSTWIATPANGPPWTGRSTAGPCRRCT